MIYEKLARIPLLGSVAESLQATDMQALTALYVIVLVVMFLMLIMYVGFFMRGLFGGKSFFASLGSIALVGIGYVLWSVALTVSVVWLGYNPTGVALFFALFVAFVGILVASFFYWLFVAWGIMLADVDGVKNE